MPGRKLTTPGGMPTSCKTSISLAPITGDCSAGFIIDRVAGDQGRGGHAGQNGQRKIPRGNHRDHAARLVEVDSCPRPERCDAGGRGQSRIMLLA